MVSSKLVGTGLRPIDDRGDNEMEEYHALTETEQEVLVDLTVNILKKKIRELEDIRMSSARYLGLLQRIEDAADKVAF